MVADNLLSTSRRTVTNLPLDNYQKIGNNEERPATVERVSNNMTVQKYKLSIVSVRKI